MNWLDLVIIGAVGLAVFSGYRRGVVTQIFSWGGFILGLVVGALLSPALIKAIDPKSPSARQITVLVSFLGIAFVVEAIVAVIGMKIARRITVPGLKQADRIIGSVVAGVVILIAAWLLSLPAKRAPAGLARTVRHSAILRGEYAILSTPPDFMAGVLRFLNRTGFPEVFTELNPSLAPGVEAPPRSLADNKAIRAAAELTYKIEGSGCGGRVDGSGFPVRADVLITAAHVVAGTHDTRVIKPDGTSFAAVVVYIDTNTDIAVLRAPALPRGTLTVDPNAAKRGDDGAAIGYPGGRARKISVARVRTRTQAVGYDIYARKRVNREIYVLRATVIPGNSGGPFVDTEGRVRGMIFAASAQNHEEAYALDEDEIDRAMARAADRRRGVDTKECAL